MAGTKSPTFQHLARVLVNHTNNVPSFINRLANVLIQRENMFQTGKIPQILHTFYAKCLEKVKSNIYQQLTVCIKIYLYFLFYVLLYSALV